MQVGVLGAVVHTIRSPLEGPPLVPVGAVRTPAVRDHFPLVVLQTGWSPVVESTITLINNMRYRAFKIFITMLRFPSCQVHNITISDMHSVFTWLPQIALTTQMYRDEC